MRKRDIKRAKREAEERLGEGKVNDLEQLKQKLLKTEAEQIKQEQRAKQEAAREREKNKTFEELLNESDMNWKKFKS